MTYNLTAPCHFGLEKTLSFEIRRAGGENITGEVDQPRREGFLYRRGVRARTIAALVQAHARGVEEDLAPVLHDREADLIRRARLRKPAQTVFLPQPRDRRLLDVCTKSLYSRRGAKSPAVVCKIS